MPVVQKFEIAKALKLRQKITKTNYEKVISYYPASTRHRFDIERLIKEKSELIWRFVFFEITVKIQMCTLFLFKKIKYARLFSNS